MAMIPEPTGGHQKTRGWLLAGHFVAQGVREAKAQTWKEFGEAMEQDFLANGPVDQEMKGDQRVCANYRGITPQPDPPATFITF